MRNEKGGAIVIAMALTILVSIGIMTSVVISQNMLDEANRQKDAMERERLASALKTMLGDQRFCGEFFKQGFNTAVGKYSLNSANLTGFPKTKVEELKNIFTVYEPGDIELSNRRQLGPYPDGVVYNQYDVSVSIVPKTGLLGRISATFGRKKLKSFGSNNWHLMMGSNNRCYIESEQNFTRQDVGVASACKALGESYVNGRCVVREFDSKYDGMIDTSKFKSNPTATFADGLCAMELAALRKMGPHMIKQSTATTEAGKKAYGWTSLCSKPKWAGCQVTKDANAVLTGNVEGGQLILSGETWTTEPLVIRDKELKNHLMEKSEPTLDRRFNRVTGMIEADQLVDSNVSYNIRIKSFETKLKDLGKKTATSLGGGGVGAGLAYGIAHMISMAWLGGPIGAAIVWALLPKCNKVRVTHTFQCVDGYPELASVKWEKQKMKIKLSGIKCKWKNGGTVPILTESDIYNLLSGKMVLNTPVTDEDLEADISGVEDVLKELERPDMTLAELVKMFHENEDDDEETIDFNIPEELMGPLQAKELELWGKYAAQANALLVTLGEVRPQGEDEADEAYQNYLNTSYNSMANQVSSILSETEKYLAFSRSIRNPDGSPRNFNETTAYTNYAAPLISNINSAGDRIKSEASGRGISELADVDLRLEP